MERRKVYKSQNILEAKSNNLNTGNWKEGVKRLSVCWACNQMNNKEFMEMQRYRESPDMVGHELYLRHIGFTILINILVGMLCWVCPCLKCSQIIYSIMSRFFHSFF